MYFIVFIIIVLVVVWYFFINGKNTFSAGEKKYVSIDEAYNRKKVEEEKRMNTLLEKISRKGIESLSAEEKKFLDAYAKR